MSGTYKLGGELFPKNPLTKVWRRTQVGVHGTNEPIFVNIWQLEMSFGWLESVAEMSFFESRFFTGGVYTAQLPHPETGQLTGFTGVYVGNFTYDFNDYERNKYAVGARLVLERINLSATGTV